MEVIDRVTNHISDQAGVDVVESLSGTRGEVKIMRVPEDDDYPTVDEFHDVIVRGDERDEVLGPFDRKEAVSKAVEVAREMNYQLLDSIYRYTPTDPSERAEYTRRFGKLDDIATYSTSVCPDCHGKIEVDWGDGVMDVIHRCADCGEEFELVEITYLRRKS